MNDNGSALIVPKYLQKKKILKIDVGTDVLVLSPDGKFRAVMKVCYIKPNGISLQLVRGIEDHEFSNVAVNTSMVCIHCKATMTQMWFPADVAGEEGGMCAWVCDCEKPVQPVEPEQETVCPDCEPHRGQIEDLPEAETENERIN